jgi:hypothetical protein
MQNIKDEQRRIKEQMLNGASQVKFNQRTKAGKQKNKNMKQWNIISNGEN